MKEKTVKRTSVIVSLMLALAMLLTCLVVFGKSNTLTASAKGNAAIGGSGKPLYVVDVGRITDSDGSTKLQYGVTSKKPTPYRGEKDITFIDRNGGTIFTGTADRTLLYNGYVDMPFGEDDQTHKKWGYVDNYSEYMAYRIGQIADVTAGYTSFRSVNGGKQGDDGAHNDVTSETLVYKFEVDSTAELDVTVITYSPSGWGDIQGKMSVNDGTAMDIVATETTETDHTISGCKGVLDSTDNKYYLTLTFGVDGAKTIVNGIVIRVKTYQVAYELDGGSHSSNPTEYSQGDTVTLTDPTRFGYDFDGWYNGSGATATKVTGITATDEGALTFYARWKPKKYTINYMIEDGVDNSANPEEYSYGTKLTLAAPTKDGYTFDGWYDGTGEDAIKVTEIAANKAGEVTLYARWTKKTETPAGGTGSNQDAGENKNEGSKGCSSSITGTTVAVAGMLLVALAGGAIIKRKSKD